MADVAWSGEVAEHVTPLLERWADGLGAVEWAVRLLAVTGWLDDAGFVAGCVVEIGERGDGVAVVDWHAAGKYAERLHGEGVGVERVLAVSLACTMAREPWRLAGVGSLETGYRP